VTESSGPAVPAAGAWGADVENWAAIQEPQVVPLYEAALEALDLIPPSRMLDAGCGAGRALVMAAARGSTVAGVDASEPMLAVARHRLPVAELKVGDLESLPWADGVFDAVTGFNSYQFAADSANALAEARRVTRAGGRVLIATWGPPERCESFGYTQALASTLPPAPSGASGPFKLSAPGVLESLFHDAGLTTLAFREVSCPFEYPDMDTALRGLLSSGGAARAIELHGRDAVREAVAGAIEPYSTGDGIVRMHNVFQFVVGRA
jgi:SAM-dependent methyltransferase